MSALRRLVINGRFLTGGATAVNTVAHRLTQALLDLDQSRFSFEVAVPRGVEGPQDWPLRTFGRLRGVAWEQFELPRLARRASVLGFFNTVPLLGQGYVTLLHDAHVFDTPESYPMLVRHWRRVLSRRAGAKGRQVLTVSNHARDRLAAVGIAPADVIYNGADHLKHQHPDPDILARLDLNRPYFLAVGSSLAHKNTDLLLRVFATHELNEVPLVLAGGARPDMFKSPPPNVIWPGFVTDAEMVALYGGARGVLMPSRAEGFGLPPVEAMGQGTPSIVAPCGALPEICGPGALYVAPDDDLGWQAAILNLLGNDALRANLVSNGRVHIARFTWQASALAVLDALGAGHVNQMHRSTRDAPRDIEP
ncbi:MAG: glycosyltransferase family 4 protein [Sedimentitalea sp.]